MNRTEVILESIRAISAIVNGGKGSGNFGHGGRPGKVGGSGSGGSVDTDTVKSLSKSFKSRVDAQRRADEIPEDDFKWAAEMTVVATAQNAMNRTFRNEFEKRGLDISRVVKDQIEWAEGNGPRDTKTGEYYSEPDLQKHRNSPEHKLHRKLTQDTLRASGITELTLYRGVREGEPEAKGYTSFTTNKAVAGTFGGTIITKKVPVKDIVSHHQVHWHSTYFSEQEVIVDLH